MLNRLLVGLVLLVLLGAAFGLILRNRLQNEPMSTAKKSERGGSGSAGQADKLPEGKAASKSAMEKTPTDISADKPASPTPSKPKSSLLAQMAERAASNKPRVTSGSGEKRPAGGGVAAATSPTGKSGASAAGSPAPGKKPTSSGAAAAVAAKSTTNQDTGVAENLDKNPLRNLPGARSAPDDAEVKHGAPAASGFASESDLVSRTGRWPNTEVTDRVNAPPANATTSAWPQDVESRAAASSPAARDVVDDHAGGTERAKAAAAGGQVRGSAWPAEETKAAGNTRADREVVSSVAPPATPQSRSVFPAETNSDPDALSSSFQPPPTAAKSRLPSAGAANLTDERDDERLNKLANSVRTRNAGPADEVKSAPRGTSGHSAGSTDFLADDKDAYRRNQRSDETLGNLQKWADGVTGSLGPTAGEDDPFPEATSAVGSIGPTGSDANATESMAGGAPRRSPSADSARTSAGTNRLLDGNRALDRALLPGAKQSRAGAASRETSGGRDTAAPQDAGALREVPRTTSSKTGTGIGAGRYVVQLNDTYWSIARSQYGAGAYFEALYEHNRARFADPDHLQEGDVLLTPPVEELARQFPNLVPKALRPEERPAVAVAPRQSADARRSASFTDASPEAPPAGVSPPGAARTPSDLLRGFDSERTVAIQGGTYSVRSGDTLFTIARQQLGSAARWVEIYDLNRDVLGADLKLHPGQQLSLPK